MTDISQWSHYLQPPPGTDIAEAAAASLSGRIEGFVFNGTVITLREEDDVPAIIRRYNAERSAPQSVAALESALERLLKERDCLKADVLVLSDKLAECAEKLSRVAERGGMAGEWARMLMDRDELRGLLSVTRYRFAHDVSCPMRYGLQEGNANCLRCRIEAALKEKP